MVAPSSPTSIADPEIGTPVPFRPTPIQSFWTVRLGEPFSALIPKLSPVIASPRITTPEENSTRSGETTPTAAGAFRTPAHGWVALGLELQPSMSTGCVMFGRDDQRESAAFANVP